jgi:RND family efflux transporter MFP subunit
MTLSTFLAPFQPIKQFATKRPLTAFLSGAILLLAFFFIRQTLTPKVEDSAVQNETRQRQVSEFEIGKDAPTGTAIGTVDQERMSTIVATVPGIIGSILVHEGSSVADHATIARITPGSAESARSFAEATLANTRKIRPIERDILDLNKKISDGETTSGRKEDLARSVKKLGSANLDYSLIAAQLNLEIAKSNAQNFAPFAPFSGTIEAILVSLGDMVTPGTPIAIISGHAKRPIVRAEIPSSIASRIDAHGAHAITIAGKESVPLTLTHISTSAVSADSFRATFSIPESEASLIGDGAIGEITLILKNTDTTFLIPISATQVTRDTATVLVDRDHVAVSVPVTSGRALGNFIEITDGLSTGDRIILDRDTHPGDAIKIK